MNITRALLPVALLLALTGCATDTATDPINVDTSAADAPTSDPTYNPMVTYTVTGDGVAQEITYQSGSGIAQVTDVVLPWSLSVPETSGGFAIYQVLAQDKTGSTISCDVSDQTGHLASNTSLGKFAVVQCLTK